LSETLSKEQDYSETDGVGRNEQEVHPENIIEQDLDVDICSRRRRVDAQLGNKLEFQTTC